LAPGDTACTAAVPPLRLVARFAVQSSQLNPATGLAGNQAGVSQLRWVSAAVLTAGDVLARIGGNSTGQGVGLRGGSFRMISDASAIHLTLDEVRWTEDLSVSGTIDKPLARTGTVHAVLDLKGPEGASGRVTIQWQEGLAGQSASIEGRIGGAAVAAEDPAP
jgi:hypothetical protein